MARHASPGRKRLSLALVLFLVAAPGCSSRLTRTLHSPEAGPPSTAGPLKGHLRDGSVLVLASWRFDEGPRLVSGAGVRLNPLRQEVARGELSIPLDSVALFETNRVDRRMPKGVLAMTVVTGVGALLCIANPKACFGSCPTFYVEAEGRWRLVAEGFSGSILPALEASDVDALPGVEPRAGVVALRMTNEAQETHVVRSVELLRVPRPPGGRAWSTGEGAFVATGPPVPPVAARGPEGDCLPALLAPDGRERTSAADSTDLAAREVLELAFAAAPEGELGLVMTTRQTLLSTYLLYQGLAWLGTDAGAWLAGIERTGAAAGGSFRPLEAALGGLTVEVEQAGAGAWTVERMPFETGPIAVDTRLVLLGRGAARPGEPLRIRLAMTRGNTRIDQVALAGARGAVEPERLRPVEVRRGGAPDAEALRDLLDPARTLVTLPGDTCELRYRLPAPVAQAPGDFEWFLEARGYYIEWMRQEWLAEEDPRRTVQLVASPREALRALAPDYARGEAERERIFWSSRHGQPAR
jgi:hypothetical protein